VIAAMVLSVLAVIAATHRSAWRYRMMHDERSLWKILHEQVRNGDSFERIHDLLTLPLPADMPTAWRERQAVLRPNGVMSTDRFYFMPCAGDQGGAVLLQFRPGESGERKLINHDPEYYSEFRESTVVSGGGSQQPPERDSVPAAH